MKIAEDDTLTYLCFANSHDGSTSVKVTLTPVRVVCMNTLSITLRRATRVWSTPHIGNICGRLEEARKTLQPTTKYMKALQEDGERLAEKSMELQQFIETLLPLPDKDAGEQAVKNVLNMRESLYHHAEAEDLKPLAGTAWQGVQAVSAYTTHAQLCLASNLLTTAAPKKLTTLAGHYLLSRERDVNPAPRSLNLG